MFEVNIISFYDFIHLKSIESIKNEHDHTYASRTYQNPYALVVQPQRTQWVKVVGIEFLTTTFVTIYNTLAQFAH